MKIDDLTPGAEMSLRDVARYFERYTGRRPTRATLLRWIHKGVSGQKLDAVRVGRDYLTTREEVDNFLIEGSADVLRQDFSDQRRRSGSTRPQRPRRWRRIPKRELQAKWRRLDF